MSDFFLLKIKYNYITREETKEYEDMIAYSRKGFLLFESESFLSYILFPDPYNLAIKSLLSQKPLHLEEIDPEFAKYIALRKFLQYYFPTKMEVYTFLSKEKVKELINVAKKHLAKKLRFTLKVIVSGAPQNHRVISIDAIIPEPLSLFTHLYELFAIKVNLSVLQEALKMVNNSLMSIYSRLQESVNISSQKVERKNKVSIQFSPKSFEEKLKVLQALVSIKAGSDLIEILRIKESSFSNPSSIRECLDLHKKLWSVTDYNDVKKLVKTVRLLKVFSKNPRNLAKILLKLLEKYPPKQSLDKFCDLVLTTIV